MSQWVKGKDCPVCGKTFYPESLVKWGWKNPKGENVCSYTCQRKSEKNLKSMSKPQRRRTPVRIIETGEVFRSISECAIHLNTSGSAIYKSISQGKEYMGYHIERVVE